MLNISQTSKNLERIGKKKFIEKKGFSLISSKMIKIIKILTQFNIVQQNNKIPANQKLVMFNKFR